MPYDHNGERIYAEDVLDPEELGQYRKQQSQTRGRGRAVVEFSADKADRENERNLDDPWGLT